MQKRHNFAVLTKPNDAIRRHENDTTNEVVSTFVNCEIF